MIKKNKNLLLILAFFSATFLLYSYHEKQETVLTNLYSTQAKLVAKQTGRLIAEQISSIKDELHVLSESPEILNAENNQKNCQIKILKTFQHISDKVNNLGRTNSDGVFICSANEKLIGQKAQTYGEFFEQIKKDPLHADVLSRQFSPPQNSGLGSALHAAVVDKNFKGTVGAGIYFESLGNKFLKDVPFFKNGYITLLDDNGDILYNDDSWALGKKIWDAQIIERFDFNSEFIEQTRKSIEMNEKFNTILKQKKNNFFDEKFLSAVLEPINLLPNRRWIIMVIIPFSDDE